MAMKAIDQVREAEHKASEAQDAADLESQRIVDEAQKKADELIAQAKAKALRRENAASAEAKLKAQEMVDARRENALRDAAALREKTMNLRQNIINKLAEETLA